MFRSHLLSLALLVFGSTALAAVDVENKWRLELSGDADSSGQITVSIADEGEPATLVTVAIAEDTEENAVAAALTNALALRLHGLYRVERDDGEDVLIKRRAGAKKFSVAVVENTVEGVRINLDEE